MSQSEMNQGNHHEARFPTQYVIGFIGSIVLTIIPLWLVLNHVTSAGPLLWLIMICAALQIVVQLFFFMHFTQTDGGGPAYHTITLGLGLLFTIIIVGCSIWIMTFGAQVS